MDLPVPIGPDGRGLPHEKCQNCYSECTTLTITDTYGLPPKAVWVCWDRELCKTILVMEHSIKNVRSAP